MRLNMASRGRRGGVPAREGEQRREEIVEPRHEGQGEQQAPAPLGHMLPPPPPVDYGVFMQGLVQAMQTHTHTQAALQAQLEAQVDPTKMKLKGMDMNAQERMVAALEMLRQDIELYAQAQQEAHMQIKEEVLNLTTGAFFAGNSGASLDVMTQVMCRLDNLRLRQDMLLHQFEGYWEALTDAARELYHRIGGEQQQPSVESVIDLTQN
ncbi:hypothetical protein Taro_027057 [Colocasia esculenta]|uniref:Uncharacterized protein n=1 Tax=Colocasia esculenta TaxID=4460 RepID=A0A843VMI9_COLES|nr:hypothetical protein [Colocasia esculenta]